MSKNEATAMNQFSNQSVTEISSQLFEKLLPMGRFCIADLGRREGWGLTKPSEAIADKLCQFLDL